MMGLGCGECKQGCGRRLHGVASFLGLNTPSLRLRGSNATLSQSFNSNWDIPADRQPGSGMSVTAIKYGYRRFRGSVAVSAFPNSPSQATFEAPNSRSASMKSLTKALGVCRSSLIPQPDHAYGGRLKLDGKLAFKIKNFLDGLSKSSNALQCDQTKQMLASNKSPIVVKLMFAQHS